MKVFPLVLLGASAARETAAETAEDGEKQKGADGAADADDDGFVVVDPGFDFAAGGGAGALALGKIVSAGAGAGIWGLEQWKENTYVGAVATAPARGAVEKVLLETVADSVSELRAGAADGAALAVASMRVVALCIAAHHGLALLVTARALSRGTFKSVAVAAAALAIRRGLVAWAIAIVAGADFFRVALTCAGATYGAFG